MVSLNQNLHSKLILDMCLSLLERCADNKRRIWRKNTERVFVRVVLCQPDLTWLSVNWCDELVKYATQLFSRLGSDTSVDV